MMPCYGPHAETGALGSFWDVFTRIECLVKPFSPSCLIGKGISGRSGIFGQTAKPPTLFCNDGSEWSPRWGCPDGSPPLPEGEQPGTDKAAGKPGPAATPPPPPPASGALLGGLSGLPILPIAIVGAAALLAVVLVKRS